MSEPSLSVPPTSPSERNLIQQVIRALRQAPATALVGLLIVGVYVVAAVFAPWIAPYGEYEVVSDIPFAPWSEANLLGTDQLGRDFLTRIARMPEFRQRLVDLDPGAVQAAQRRMRRQSVTG